MGREHAGMKQLLEEVIGLRSKSEAQPANEQRARVDHRLDRDLLTPIGE